MREQMRMKQNRGEQASGEWPSPGVDAGLQRGGYVVITLIDNGAQHDKRYVVLACDSGDGRAFHVDGECLMTFTHRSFFGHGEQRRRQTQQRAIVDARELRCRETM